MMKHSAGLLAFFFLACILPQLNAAESWSSEHREARRAFLKICEVHKNFREAFSKWLEEHPKHAEALVKYVAEDEEHTIEGFIKRHAAKESSERRSGVEEVEASDLSALRRIHENHLEAMKKFRNWIQEYPKAAEQLAKHPRLVHELEEEAREHR